MQVKQVNPGGGEASLEAQGPGDRPHLAEKSEGLCEQVLPAGASPWKAGPGLAGKMGRALKCPARSASRPGDGVLLPAAWAAGCGGVGPAQLAFRVQRGRKSWGLTESPGIAETCNLQSNQGCILGINKSNFKSSFCWK